MKKLLSFFSLLFVVVYFSGCSDEPTTVTEENTDNSTSLAKVSYPLADDYIVEFSGTAAELQSAVESVGGVVDASYPEIGYAKVSKLDYSSTKILLKKNGIKDVTQDYMVPWVTFLIPFFFKRLLVEE